MNYSFFFKLSLPFDAKMLHSSKLQKKKKTSKTSNTCYPLKHRRLLVKIKVIPHPATKYRRLLVKNQLFPFLL